MSVHDEQKIWLYSYGWNPETCEQLQAKAETAERVIGCYGVTVWAWAAPPQEPVPQATMAAVKKHFGIQQTTDDPFHDTLIFQKPLTQEQVKTFHAIFSKQ